MDKILDVIKKMSFLKKVFAIAIYSIKQRIINPRIICLFVIFGIFVWHNISFASEATTLLNLKINPLLYPFLSDDSVKQLVICAGIIFLFSDAPFIDKSQPYIIIRSKRTAWALGQILHIIIFSGVYFLIFMGFSFLIIMPYSTLATDGWGKVVNTLAQTDLTSQLDMGFGFSATIISLYSPIQAFVLNFLLNWALASFLGMLIFAVNLKFDKMIGPVVALVWLLLDLLIVNYLPYSWFKYSPLSMSRLSVLDPTGMTTAPSPTYALSFYSVGIIIFSAFIIAVVKRKLIEISSEA